MKEVIVVEISYEPEQKIALIEEEVRPYPYLTPVKGFKAEKAEDGWLYLKKEEAVLVTLKGSNLGYNVKRQVCDFYKEAQMTQDLFNRFCEDVRNKTVKIYLDDNKNIVIK